MKKAHLIIALFICACSGALAVGQEKETLRALSAVNEQSRPRLAKRLEEFIAHNRSKDWHQLFKLIDKYNASHYTPETFAKMMSEFGQRDFVPERATVESPIGEEYRIYGCVTQRSVEVKSFQGGLVAYLQDGDWYFTTYFLSYGSDSLPLPCRP